MGIPTSYGQCKSWHSLKEEGCLRQPLGQDPQQAGTLCLPGNDGGIFQSILHQIVQLLL